MIINHNMMAMNTHRQLSLNNTATQKSIEKLSSGYRINRAGDDAAGLAISEKMRGQIRGLNQASRNSQDAISLIQTGEGALNETHDILQRMRELAVQASSDTNVIVDRGEIQKEINQLTSEINRIGNTTEFNTMKLLDGSRSDKAKELYMAGKLGTQAVGAAEGVTAQTGAIELETNITLGTGALGAGLEFDTIDLSAADTASIVISKTADGKLRVVTNLENSASVSVSFDDLAEPKWDTNNEYTFNTHEVSFKITKADFDAATVDKTLTLDLKQARGTGAADGTYQTKNDFDSNTDTPSTITTGITFKADLDKSARFIDIQQTSATTFKVIIKDEAGAALQTDTLVFSSISTGKTISYDNHGVEFTYKYAGTASETVAIKDFEIDLEQKTESLGDKSLAFQVGANENQAMSLGLSDMRAVALGISSANAGAAGFGSTLDVTNGTDSKGAEYALDVSNHTAAAASVTTINKAIETVSAERSKLGAVQNRLEHTIKNLDTSSENLQAAESRIRDVDMAKEMMEFTKNNILQQAAQAMLAQANQAPQGVLQLLR